MAGQLPTYHDTRNTRFEHPINGVRDCCRDAKLGILPTVVRAGTCGGVNAGINPSGAKRLGSGILVPTPNGPALAEDELARLRHVDSRNPGCSMQQACQISRCSSRKQTICYVPPARRNDCYPADPRAYDLAYNDAFEDFDIGTSRTRPWVFFTNGDFTANDGNIRVGLDALTITANPFTKTSPVVPVNNGAIGQVGFLDHFKTMCIKNSDFDTAECGETYVEATMTAKAYNVNQQPFGDAVLDPQGDLRLAYSTLSMVDFDSGMHFAMAHTNDAMYAINERWPFEKDEESEEATSASFMGATSVFRRIRQNALVDYNTVGIGYDKRKGVVRWYLNGNLVHQHVSPGTRPNRKDIIYDLGGVAHKVDINTLNVGMGHFTCMDGLIPNGDESVAASGLAPTRLTAYLYHTPYEYDTAQVTFVDESGSLEYRLFGQGATLKMTNLKVEYRC